MSFLFFQSCSTFLIGNPPVVSKLETNVDKEVTYELIGWKEDSSKKLASEILRTFHLSGRFKKLSVHTKTDSEINIQIILEKAPRFSLFFGEHSQPLSWMLEKEPVKFSLYLLNRIAAYRTFLIFPIIQKSSDHVLFKVWKRDQKLAEYSYSIENVFAIGWIPLLLMPFDDKDEIEFVYASYAKKFLSDSRSIY
ncbi:hypothetical protein [Leptospira stimsonii]|uniref:Lipoprotein n=1 Tax=Leptospira stimsonii TaxID=2202203 RepID=A0ABY2MUB9_9LEPT|nr:hypothetical protein [Leptospira stimsonii]TGK15403.1 hypothetical protein EHO98_14470 [Leptospira stimsonii]TGM08267.1 hypothetical protein EHQ90_22435 [Leptospira stimsonii]